MIRASRFPANVWLMRRATVSADWLGRGRLSQSLSLTTTMSELWALPAKLKPTTVTTPSTVSFSWVNR